MDGAVWWRVEAMAGGRLRIESNEPDGAFRRYFTLDEPIGDLRARVLEEAPEFGAEIGALRGLRLCQPHSAEETFFSFLCTANNHLPRIESMVRKLEAFGPEAECGGNVFPSPRRLAEVTESQLRQLGFGYRAATISAAARKLGQKEPGWLDRLGHGSYGQAFQALLEFPGVGPKLADCIALYGLHFWEAVPVDTHLWQAAKAALFPEFSDGAITAKRYRAIGDRFRERFGRHAGWAQLLLYAANMERSRTARRRSL
jgi:N-glycosylase/DNA lyase